MTAINFEINKVMAESLVAAPPTTPVTPGDLDPRVKDGVAYLDEHVPDWADQIRIEAFDITDYNDCVLGQLYGAYDKGVRVHSLSVAAEHSLGFNVDSLGFNVDGVPFANDGEEEASWDALNESWHKVIAARQNVKVEYPPR